MFSMPHIDGRLYYWWFLWSLMSLSNLVMTEAKTNRSIVDNVDYGSNLINHIWSSKALYLQKEVGVRHHSMFAEVWHFSCNLVFYVFPSPAIKVYFLLMPSCKRRCLRVVWYLNKQVEKVQYSQLKEMDKNLLPST